MNVKKGIGNRSAWLATSPNQTKSLEDALQTPGFLAGREGGSLDLI